MNKDLKDVLLKHNLMEGSTAEPSVLQFDGSYADLTDEEYNLVVETMDLIESTYGIDDEGSSIEQFYDYYMNVIEENGQTVDPDSLLSYAIIALCIEYEEEVMEQDEDTVAHAGLAALAGKLGIQGVHSVLKSRARGNRGVRDVSIGAAAQLKLEGSTMLAVADRKARTFTDAADEAASNLMDLADFRAKLASIEVREERIRLRRERREKRRLLRQQRRLSRDERHLNNLINANKLIYGKSTNANKMKAAHREIQRRRRTMNQIEQHKRNLEPADTAMGQMQRERIQELQSELVEPLPIMQSSNQNASILEHNIGGIEILKPNARNVNSTPRPFTEQELRDRVRYNPMSHREYFEDLNNLSDDDYENYLETIDDLEMLYGYPSTDDDYRGYYESLLNDDMIEIQPDSELDIALNMYCRELEEDFPRVRHTQNVFDIITHGRTATQVKLSRARRQRRDQFMDTVRELARTATGAPLNVRNELQRRLVEQGEASRDNETPAQTIRRDARQLARVARLERLEQRANRIATRQANADNRREGQRERAYNRESREISRLERKDRRREFGGLFGMRGASDFNPNPTQSPRDTRPNIRHSIIAGFDQNALDILEHHGILGMRWGVRLSDEERNARRRARRAAKAAGTATSGDLAGNPGAVKELPAQPFPSKPTIAARRGRDRVLQQGAQLTRTSSVAEEQVRDGRLYATTNEKDRRHYQRVVDHNQRAIEAGLGTAATAGKDKMMGRGYTIRLEAIKDIGVCGLRNQERIERQALADSEGLRITVARTIMRDITAYGFSMGQLKTQSRIDLLEKAYAAVREKQNLQPMLDLMERRPDDALSMLRGCYQSPVFLEQSGLRHITKVMNDHGYQAISDPVDRGGLEMYSEGWRGEAWGAKDVAIDPIIVLDAKRHVRIVSSEAIAQSSLQHGEEPTFSILTYCAATGTILDLGHEGYFPIETGEATMGDTLMKPEIQERIRHSEVNEEMSLEKSFGFGTSNQNAAAYDGKTNNSSESLINRIQRDEISHGDIIGNVLEKHGIIQHEVWYRDALGRFASPGGFSAITGPSIDGAASPVGANHAEQTGERSSTAVQARPVDPAQRRRELENRVENVGRMSNRELNAAIKRIQAENTLQRELATLRENNPTIAEQERAARAKRGADALKAFETITKCLSTKVPDPRPGRSGMIPIGQLGVDYAKDKMGAQSGGGNTRSNNRNRESSPVSSILDAARSVVNDTAAQAQASADSQSRVVNDTITTLYDRIAGRQMNDAIGNIRF